MARTAHLVRRFLGSLRPGGPPGDEVLWVHAQLLPGERAIWDAMSGPDRRHSVAVARRVESQLGTPVDRPVLAAALLHDSGKSASRLRTPARVGVTLAAAVRGRERMAAGDGRAAQYLRHDDLGAGALERAGSDALTVAWTREHHRPRSTWTVPPDIADALHAADDD
ncbi:MAG: hypothetical protein Q8K58_13505 [Acidimicrobiales bacterium]|nr:hypothetical protein [Acidimicrobiales bacterium]